MVSAIKTIRVKNIQSHKDTMFELPETGIVQFTGPNSAGKSVLRLLLMDVISGKISQSKVRKSLINHDAGVYEGTLEIEKYDGTKLFVCINYEASQTYATLTRSNGEEVKRWLSDKTIPELVTEFGFHYMSDRDLSLNICDSDESILFVKTGHRVNGDILESVMTDKSAQSKYELLKTAYQEASDMRRQFADNIRVDVTAREALPFYDVEKEEDFQNKLNFLATILENFYEPQYEEPDDIPMFSCITVPNIRVDIRPLPAIFNIPEVNIQSMDNLCKDIISIEEGVCPTCKRPYSSHQTCTSGM